MQVMAVRSTGEDSGIDLGPGMLHGKGVEARSGPVVVERKCCPLIDSR